jgi:hypothetical protein
LRELHFNIRAEVEEGQDFIVIQRYCCRDPDPERDLDGGGKRKEAGNITPSRRYRAPTPLGRY